MNTVSVIIPTRDRAAMLPRALDSVLAQTRAPEEVIVVDDGSLDDTTALLARRYPGVTCLRQPHRGVSAARNAGIGHARGTWLAFLDSDDAWLPHKLERQLELLAREPHWRIVHCEEIWIRHGRRVNPMKKHAKAGGWIFERCLPLCVISPSAVMIHREVFAAVGCFDENLPACEDYDLWLRICCRHPVAFIEEPLIVKYGGHADQLSRRHWGMDRFRIQALDRLLREAPLSAPQRAAARAMLHKKAAIYLQGAARRGRHEEVARCTALLRRHGLAPTDTAATPQSIPGPSRDSSHRRPAL